MCFTPPLLCRSTQFCAMHCVDGGQGECVVCETSWGWGAKSEAKLFKTISQPKILRLSLFSNNSCEECCVFVLQLRRQQSYFSFRNCVIALYCYMWIARRLPATWLMVDKRKEIWWIVKIASSYGVSWSEGLEQGGKSQIETCCGFQNMCFQLDVSQLDLFYQTAAGPLEFFWWVSFVLV